MSLKSLDQARSKTAVVNNGETRYLHEFLGDSASPGPQGFLVALPPHSTVRPHFHAVDQFQVFFGVPGATYLRRPLESPRIHYADAYTPYGPFATGDHELQFFTLRPKGDSFIVYLPEGRKKLPRKPRRNIHTHITPTDGTSMAPGETSVEFVIDPDHDGLCAYLVRGGAGARISGPVLPEGAVGQYYCVVGGSVVQNGIAFGEKSLGWVGPRTPPPELLADRHKGFEVLVMQFPRSTVDHGGDSVPVLEKTPLA